MDSAQKNTNEQYLEEKGKTKSIWNGFTHYVMCKFIKFFPLQGY